MPVNSKYAGEKSKMYKNILIATDGSEFAGRAINHGLELAKAIGSTVTIATVTEIWSALDMAHKSKVGIQNPINEYEKTVAAVAEKILASAADLAKQTGISCECIHVKDQHPAEGIIATAKDKNCDLIVMASHGRRGIQKVLLGSVASEILTHSKIPVLIIK